MTRLNIFYLFTIFFIYIVLFLHFRSYFYLKVEGDVPTVPNFDGGGGGGPFGCVVSSLCFWGGGGGTLARVGVEYTNDRSVGGVDSPLCF